MTSASDLDNHSADNVDSDLCDQFVQNISFSSISVKNLNVGTHKMIKHKCSKQGLENNPSLVLKKWEIFPKRDANQVNNYV